MRLQTGLRSLRCYGPLPAIAAVAMGAAQIYQGAQANKMAKQQASMQEEQAEIARSEAERAAGQKDVERRRFLAEQRMAYSANGVSLEGTPMVVGEDTWKEFQMEIDAIRKSGAAQYAFGMREAGITRNQGRAQLVSGVLSGVGTAAMGGYRAGVFGKAGTTATKPMSPWGVESYVSGGK